MKIGEVCLLTNDVPRLASFYRQLLGVEESSNDETHQFVLAEETALTVYNDGTEKTIRIKTYAWHLQWMILTKRMRNCCPWAQGSSNHPQKGHGARLT